MLNPDRYFSSEPTERKCARQIYEAVQDLPIISPHGHTDPKWFASNLNFSNASELLIIPDHYVLRMLYSQGISMESLGRTPGKMPLDAKKSREVWSTFAANYHLFLGTPSRLWLEHVFQEVFKIKDELNTSSADKIYDQINEALKSPEFKPRALLEKFKIKFLSTTDSPIDDLSPHYEIQKAKLKTRVVPCFRPDAVIDPENESFFENLRKLGTLTDCDINTYTGYIKALKVKRAEMQALGATATDHGHPTPKTLDLSEGEARELFGKILTGNFNPLDAENFRAHMLMQMAEMSLSDGLVMQIHPGSFRNHNQTLFNQIGRDVGADIPMQTEFVKNLKPILNKFGNNPKFNFIVFTLDESTYSRELAPLAGHYPALKLGPAWWFHDSPNGMLRFREQTTETAGFYNTVGFNDDTRAFLSIPARHDLARRVDARYLAKLVAEHQMTLEQAQKLAADLAYNFVKTAYRIHD